MQLVFQHDQEIARWVGERTRATYGQSRAIGIADGDELIAGVVYSNFREGNIEMSIAADHPRWCRRGIIRALFHYPLVQLECRRITCIIPADNQKSLRLCRGLGFKIEGLCREVFGPVDGIICGLLKRECKWLK